MTLNAQPVMNLHVQCEKCKDVKNDGSGYLRVIPIIGGTFDGKLSGTILPGGADWNTRFENGRSHAFAKYMLKTDDGEFIAVENEGKIDREEKAYIKTMPRFQADENGKYGWLNSGVYVASLKLGQAEGQIEISVFLLD